MAAKKVQNLHSTGNLTVDSDCGNITVVNRQSPRVLTVSQLQLQAEVKDISQRLAKQEGTITAMQGLVGDLNRELRKLETSSDLALGRNRNVVVKGIEEPICTAPRQRERELRHHVTNILRLASVPGHVLLKRVFRLGRWTRKPDDSSVAPRPVLIEFGNPRHRDVFLAAAEIVKRRTEGRISVQPDFSASGRKVQMSGERAARSQASHHTESRRALSNNLEQGSPKTGARSTRESYASVVERSFRLDLSPVLRTTSSPVTKIQTAAKNGGNTVWSPATG